MANTHFKGKVSGIEGLAVGAKGAEIDVAGSDGKISTNGVVTASITDGAVTEGKIGPGAVTATKIGTGAVTNAKLADATKVVHNIRTRVTAAQVNAGHTLLAAVAAKKYRIHDFAVIAIGGNAGGATSVDLKAGSTVIAAVAVVAMTQSTVVKPNTANVTVLADGASFAPMAANTAITVIKAGSDLTTATNVDVILSYTLED